MTLKKSGGYSPIYIVIALSIAFVLTFTIATFAFGGYSAPTDGEWFNITWHYRARFEINTTAVNVTDWPIEMQINFTDLLPEGTFDNRSVRVIEYNSSGKVMQEVASQFDKGDNYTNTTNAVGELVFIMNGTTPPNSKRIFYVYFDTGENGVKPLKTYSTSLTYSWDGQEARINTSRIEVRIDTNRGDNASGIHYVEEKTGGVPVIITTAGERPAEYLEFFNGTTNTTFDLIGNATFVTGPVRITIIQEGQEIVLGNLSKKTNQSKIVKKYYFYNRAGPQGQGSFIKMSHEFLSTATINRSSNVGAAAFDLQRTFLSQDMNTPTNSSVDPYSWVFTTDSGGSVAGLVNINETYTTNYSAGYDSSIGRLGINLLNTNLTAGSSIKQSTLVYFATGAANGVSEFLQVRNSTTYPPIIKMNLTEKLITSIKPEINSSVYNLNETIIIRANVSTGDPYNLIARINATINLGTPAAGDDLTLQLYDDGTNSDQVSGDKVFTNIYNFSLAANLTEWRLNMTAYTNSSEYLNSTIFTFNVTNIYSVNLTIFNAIGIVSRQVFAELAVKNFNRTAGISAALINCSFGATEIFNKTDNGNGNYSLNFTAPNFIGSFSIFCNATKYNNTGNDTKIFTTETPQTNVTLNVTPQSVTIGTIGVYDNATFAISGNATNAGNGTSKMTNITLQLLSGWSANTTYEDCGNLPANASCLRWFNVTVPNATSPGTYVINATATWTNPDDTQNFTKTNVTITVLSNPRINVTQRNVTGTGADGTQKTVGVFNVLSVGNDVVSFVSFNCTSGVACQDFNISFSPQNITASTPGTNTTVNFVARVSLNYTPGLYNGTVNVTGANTTFVVDIFVTIQATTNFSVTTQPPSIVVTGISVFTGASFPFLANATNIGNASGRNTTINFTLPANWSINSSFDICGTVTYNSSCLKNNTVTVPNSTAAGNYTINITVRWLNVDYSNGTLIHVFNATVAESPVIIFDNDTKFGYARDGALSNPFNLTVLSVGASAANGIAFNCTSGIVCANFSPTFVPSSIASLPSGTNTTVRINVTIPTMFHAGNYTGILNVTSTNAANRSVTLIVEVLANRTWTITPLFCKRSMFPDVGKVCDVNVSNTGNALLNFTINNTIQNFTTTNVTSFVIDQYQNYTFSVLYNVTGIPQFIYNSTFVISSVDPAVPQNMTLNISLLPSTPPLINLTFNAVVEQADELVITANITDMTNSGITLVNVTVVRFNGTVDFANMSLVSTVGNQSIWTATYAANIPNYTFGNTTIRGIYNISVLASDNLGNLGNKSANFTVRKKVSIASNTLSQQYVQGDTGTIYYSARSLNNTGVPDINVSFWLFDPNMTLIYYTNRTTDSVGTFVPLPVFSFASDAPVGNYILISNSTFTDEALNRTFTVTKNYTAALQAKTVVVTGLFADIETAVVWFPNNIMRFNILIYDGEGKAVDPTDLNLSVYDPAQNLYFATNISAMTKKGVGFYAYSYAMPANTATGMYLAVANITRGTLTTMKLKAFRVAQGGPYDVRLTLVKNEVEQGTPLDFVLTIENKGEVTQDVFVNYSVINPANGQVYYFASEAVLTPAFTNMTFTRSAFIFSNQPLGNYLLRAVVKYDNTQPEINASSTFTVLAKRNVPPPPAAGGGGGGGAGQGTGVTGEISGGIPESANSITIEKYSKEIKVYPGFKRIEYVIVRNSGNSALRDISLNIIGLPVSWYNITPSVYREILAGNAETFLVEYNVPENAALGNYKFNFVATASTTSDQKEATLKIVGSLEDIVISDLAQLKEDLKNLLIDIGVAKNQGKNVDQVLLLADEVQKYINKAETNYNLNNTKEAVDNIRDGRIVLERAREMLRNLQVVVGAGGDMTLIIIIMIIPVAIVIFVFLKRKNKVPKKFSQTIVNFAGILEKIHKKAPDASSVEKEREKMSRMAVVLDRERKENIISEQAYNEMKKNVETKLEKLNKKLKA